jgi:hypothetical protein
VTDSRFRHRPRPPTSSRLFECDRTADLLVGCGPVRRDADGKVDVLEVGDKDVSTGACIGGGIDS